jgi:catechol 2,3-dioxygenase-like lactoylglutathione lyase family enzyme
MKQQNFFWSALILFSLSAKSQSQEPSILGLAHVGLAVTDIDRAKQFYDGMLGFDMGFDLKKPDGSLFLQYYKVNDNQFIEIYPTLKPGDLVRETHIAFYTDDIQALHKAFEDRGLKPSPVSTNKYDGNQGFDLRHPAGQELVFLEFVHYMPGSLHTNNRGKMLSSRRISTHMRGAGVLVTDPVAAEAMYKSMGFKEVWRGSGENGQAKLVDMQTPGASGDYVELVERSSPFTAEQAGLAGHVALEVSDIKSAYKMVRDRGGNPIRRPELSKSKTWNLGVLDPNGSEILFQQPR